MTAIIGRPSDYTEEIAIEICALLASGKPLVQICKDDRFPSVVTIYSWLNKNTDFLNMYTRAREDQADTLADEIIQISDDGLNDTYVDADGFNRTDAENIARSRLRVESRKWVASKLKPKKYGDKQEVDLKSSDGTMSPKSLNDFYGKP